jgi:hypothetical protein
MSSLDLPLFESDTPLDVEGGPDGYTYVAAKLNIIGRNTRSIHQNRFVEFLQNNWKFNKDTQKYVFKDENDEEDFGAVSNILWNQGFAIVMSDKNRKLNAAKIIDIMKKDADFFERCYDAAIKMNPVFDPEWAAVLEQQAQAETKKDDGSTITPDEASPLDSGTPKSTSKK